MNTEEAHMNTAIVYYSRHHENTKKIVDFIAKEGSVTLINAIQIEKVDLTEYELIGFASGIYYSKFDTFGPFKIVGGIAKGHPTDEEISEAVRVIKEFM